MAFENVNVDSLRNALNSCKNAINHSISENLIGNIEESSNWVSSAKHNLNKSLNTLTNERYKSLEQLIDKYLEVTNYIGEYKQLEQENKELSQQYNNLSSRLYYTEYYTETSTDIEGNTISITKSRRVKDYGVERQMININQKIIENKEKMENLNTKVRNSI